MKTLIFGYGNPGRQDDGLGVFFAEALEKRVVQAGLSDIHFDANYQLNIEDAYLIADFDRIFFADAAQSQTEPFVLKKLCPRKETSFTTHSMAPESILSLCQELYNVLPDAFLLTFRAKDFGINDEPTTEAKKYIDEAVEYLMTIV